MAKKIFITQPDFEKAFGALISSRQQAVQSVAPTVSSIVSRVRAEGDIALFDYTRRFDRFEPSAQTVEVQPQEIANALSLCLPELMRSLKIACARIREYSKQQMPQDLDYVDGAGVRLGHRWSAIDRVGLYVPGGLAAYPSSVLMNAVPAKVAGVKELIMVVPHPDGKTNPAVLAAAHVAGVDRIFKIGGAQAVAALAYGTASIPAVDKIVGPGNSYVAEAKRQVFGKVGIDMIAGPSEILVISDNRSNPAWIASDLLSQAEHDEAAQSILITDDSAYADVVLAAVEALLATLPREAIARASWRSHGAVIVVENLHQACELANRIAPEHLELALYQPEEILPQLRHAGAIFLGRYTPEAIGDYIAGPSHVLPTSGTARFSSGLSVYDFLKRTSIAGCTPASFASLAPYVLTLAESEGLGAHALSIATRKEAISEER
ncbi:MAG: histidinol dehydrogenase [Alphaproteobacteria bacterium]|nr:histidinol dehydrogenase [Alphaproteobacteria bacterium]